MTVLAVGGLTAAERPARDARAMEEALAVQVFLDRANFGPGKLDGHWGDFTMKALERYRKAKGGTAASATPPAGAPPAAATSRDPEAESGARSAASAKLPEPEPISSERDRNDAGGLRTKDKKAEPDRSEAKPAARAPKVDVSDLDLKSVAPVFVDYTVTDADAQGVDELPDKPAAKAKLKWLPYTSVAEAVAERFHMDVDFLEELNPGKTKNLRPGDILRVPNVEPFDLASVKDMKPGSVLSAKGAANAEETADEQREDNARSKAKGPKAGEGKTKGDRTAKGDEKPEAPASAAFSVVVSKDENMLEVFDAGRMIAAFPVTVGSSETASPIGEWKVRGVAKLPEFRWDEKMLKEGERSSEFHLLPPGPNSPVGVIWIALNRKGVGIHGSDSPDAIGRNVSHGCIRLANWDVLKLASMVKTGVPVSIR